MKLRRKYSWGFISMLVLTVLSTCVVSSDLTFTQPYIKTSGDGDPNTIIDIQGIGWTRDDTVANANVTATEQITDSGLSYVFDYELKTYTTDSGESSFSDPVALQIMWVENQTAEMFIRYVNGSIPKGSREYTSGVYQFNTSQSLDCVVVMIKFVQGRVWKTFRWGQHAEYDVLSSWGALPMLVSTPNRFDYLLNIKIEDGINSSHHQITNKVFWPNISDHLAFGETNWWTVSQKPVNSALFDDMNMTFYTQRKTSHINEYGTGTWGDPIRHYMIWNHTRYGGFIWHTFLDNYQWSADHIVDDYYLDDDTRFFTHEYEIEFGAMVDSNGFEIEIEFGYLEPPCDSKIPGFHGLFVITLCTLIAIVVYVRRKLSITQK